LNLILNSTIKHLDITEKRLEDEKENLKNLPDKLKEEAEEIAKEEGRRWEELYKETIKIENDGQNFQQVRLTTAYDDSCWFWKNCEIGLDKPQFARVVFCNKEENEEVFFPGCTPPFFVEFQGEIVKLDDYQSKSKTGQKLPHYRVTAIKSGTVRFTSEEDYQTIQDSESEDDNDNRLKNFSSKIEELKQNRENLIEAKKNVEVRLFGKFFNNHFRKSPEEIRPTMTFVQNPRYRGVYRFYQDLLRDVGMEDIRTYELYEEIVSYGMRNLPEIYELWCLIKILNTLRDEFHLVCEKGKIEELLNGIYADTSINDFKFDFSWVTNLNFVPNKVVSDQTWFQSQRVSLAFHPSGKNDDNSRVIDAKEDRTPDLWLRVEKKDNEKWTPIVNVILDAKCMTLDSSGKWEKLTLKICNKYRFESPKDQGNKVFLMHPVQGLNNLGSRKFFESNECHPEGASPLHEYGYFCLRPDDDFYLRKLILMVLEYFPIKNRRSGKQFVCVGYGEDLSYDRNKKSYLCNTEGCKCVEDKNCNPKHKIESECDPAFFCKECGGRLLSDQGEPDSYFCENDNCSNKKNENSSPTVVINHCWNCGTLLVRHHPLESYHEVSPSNVFDVRCPACGLYYADMLESSQDSNLEF